MRVAAVVAALLLSGCASSVAAPGLTEDSPGWDCRIHGNRVCGPGNAQGVAPGDYS
jgi:Spy/CpxP family protein refolding chaperone